MRVIDDDVVTITVMLKIITLFIADISAIITLIILITPLFKIVDKMIINYGIGIFAMGTLISVVLHMCDREEQVAKDKEL